MSATTLASSAVDIVLYRLGEDPAAPIHWSRAEILDLVWEGLLEATLISGHLQAAVNVTLAGNSIQAAPNHIAILHVRIGNSSLQEYSVDELDAGRPGWVNEAPVGVPSRWSPIGTTKLLTEPRSGSSSPVAVCTVLQFPAVLAEASVIPLEDEYVEALENYAFSAARLKEGGAEWKQSLADYDRCLQRIGQLAERVQWKNAPEWVNAPKTLMAVSVPRQGGRR